MDDCWKDAFLLRDKITLAEFNALPEEQKKWLIEHKNVFYQLNGSDILNLLHKNNANMNKILKVTAWGIKNNPRSYKRIDNVK